MKDVTKNIITPDLSALLDERIAKGLGNLNCTTIGTIESFDSTTQTASISVNYKRKVGDVFVEYPLLLDCPIVFLSGGSSYLTFPVAAGDTCIVMFCDRDIDTWFDSGQILAPRSIRKHNLSDGIALIGIRSMLNMLTSFNVDRPSLTDQSGERLNQSGDTKTSLRSANHSGWLVMDGSTIGSANSAATYKGSEYKDLFNLLKAVSPNLGTEVFSNNDTVKIMDMRGRGVVGADNMGGGQANILTAANQPNRNVLGGEIGEEKHTTTIAEMPAHTHGYTDITGGGGGWNEGTANGGYTAQTLSTGGGVAHNNIPPSLIMYWFIKI